MPVHNHQLIAVALLGDFQDGNASPAVIDEFKSALIVAYEQALESGVSPVHALGAMLDWASLEFRRCAGLPFVDG
jgi:hypothetical protein